MAAPHARLFFALWPDRATRRSLAQWQQVLQPTCGGRSMHIDDVHLTLAFLGDMPLELLDSITRAVADVNGSPFNLRVDQVQYWRHNKIVWAGAEEIPPALESMAGDLRDRLTQASIPFDPKPFVPHITLFRNARPTLPLPALPAIEWAVDAFVLVRSTGGAGPRYRVEASWPLDASRASD